MSYTIEDLAKQLRDTRKKNGLSQRKLSALAGLPQSHISKIENGSTDFRASSLIAIARALDLELALVPHKALPAVKSIARSMAEPEASSTKVRREIQRLAGAIKSTGIAFEPSEYQDILRRIRKIEQYQGQINYLDKLVNLRKAFEIAGKSTTHKTVNDALKQFRAFIILIESNLPDKGRSETRRPAYSLEWDDD